MGWLLSGLQYFGAGELSSFDDVEIVTVVSLLDHLLASLESDLLNGPNDDVELRRIQGTEHEGLAEA